MTHAWRIRDTISVALLAAHGRWDNNPTATTARSNCLRPPSRRPVDLSRKSACVLMARSMISGLELGHAIQPARHMADGARDES